MGIYSLFQAPRKLGPLNWESANTKIKREETGERRDGGNDYRLSLPSFFLFPAPPTFHVFPTIWEPGTGWGIYNSLVVKESI